MKAYQQVSVCCPRCNHTMLNEQIGWHSVLSCFCHGTIYEQPAVELKTFVDVSIVPPGEEYEWQDSEAHS